MFELRIKIEGDAFAEDTQAEVARLLRNAADQVLDGAGRRGANGSRSSNLFDINGNNVGRWELALPNGEDA